MATSKRCIRIRVDWFNKQILPGHFNREIIEKVFAVSSKVDEQGRIVDEWLCSFFNASIPLGTVSENSPGHATPDKTIKSKL